MRILAIVFSIIAIGNGTALAGYTITDLGKLGGRYSYAQAINIRGQVVGYSETALGEKIAFLWTPETGMVNLGTLGGSISAAYDINDSGVVVGESTTATSTAPHAFLYDGDEMYDLGTLGGGFSIAYGINNVGHVTGESQSLTGGGRHAFLYDGDEMYDLGCPGDPSCASYGTNINDYDQVVGYTTNPECAFLYDNNEMQDIGTLGGESVVAHDINNSGMVVGTAETTGGPRHAFIFDGNELQDLSTLDGYGSTAWGINNLGEVVGDSGVPSGVGHAFLWDSLNGMRDLNDLIPTDSGWELRSAQDVNDVGQIVGYGGIDLDADGIYDERRAFLLTPIAQDADDDGIPDDEDACPNSDLSSTVIIDGWDTGVGNVLLVDGCTISDLISQCAEYADNHGEFVIAVSHTTNSLKQEGLISGKDKGRIQKGAAKADIP